MLDVLKGIFIFLLHPAFIASNKQTIHSPRVPNRIRKRGIITTKKSVKGEGTYLANEVCNSISLPSHLAKRIRNERTTR